MIKPKKTFRSPSAGSESGPGRGLGNSRGNTGEGLTGSKKINPKPAPNKATPKKKDYSANEKSLNDAVSRILNGPWRTDL